DAPLARLVLERLADDAAGQVGGEPADLTAQLDDGLLALGLDLLVRALGDPPRLLVRPLPQLGDDLGALRFGVLADAGRLLAGLLELGVVLLECRLGRRLRLLGLGDASSMAAVRSA